MRYRADHPWIVALPRGGVPVAREVARALEAPMEVFVVRKLGAPFQPEYGLGAVAEDGTLWVDPRAAEYGVRGGALDAIVARERVEIARRVARYRGARPFPDVRGAAVILVDDGIATGGTARVAVRALRAMGVARLVLAAPVAAAETLDALRPEVDDIVCLETPVDLGAVALWYRDFDQVPDEEVLAGLVACDRERRGASRRIDG